MEIILEIICPGHKQATSNSLGIVHINYSCGGYFCKVVKEKFSESLQRSGYNKHHLICDKIITIFKEKQMKQTHKQFLTILSLATLCLVFSSTLDAVPVDTLRAPMQAMKKEVWSYLFPIKVASVVVGSAFSLMRQSLMPFGIGAGISASIQFFDSVLGDGSAALI